MKNEKQKESQNKMKIKMEKTGCKSTEAGSCAAQKNRINYNNDKEQQHQQHGAPPDQF